MSDTAGGCGAGDASGRSGPGGPDDGSALRALTEAARATWAAENRAAAARFTACYQLFRECVRRDEAGVGDGLVPGYAVIDPFAECAGQVVAAMPISCLRAESMISFAVDLTERYPAILAALASGRMEQRAAELLARQMSTVDPAVLEQVQREVVEDYLAALEGGERLGDRTVREAADAIIRRYDANGIRERKADAARDRGVHFRKGADGMANLWATLAADEAAVLAERIDQRANEFTNPDPDTTSSAAGGTATAGSSGAPSDTLKSDSGSNSDSDSGADADADADAEVADMSYYPLPQRRADALMSLVCGDRGYARATGLDPDEPPAPLRPKVTVFAPGNGADPQVEFPRTGESAINALLAMLATSSGATLERIDPAPGAADDARRALNYRPSTALARRVRLRDGTCRHPGCTVPAENCDLDHARPFDHDDPSSGGHTEECNLMCLCRRHHRFKTFSGWLYDLSPDGTLVVITPDGATMLTRPSGPLAAFRREQARAEQQAWAKQQTRTPNPTTTSTTDAGGGDPNTEPTYWHRRAARLRAERAKAEQRRAQRETTRNPSTGAVPGNGAGPGRTTPSTRSRWWDRNKPIVSQVERQIQQLIDELLDPPPF
ncbi:HNH endonuclease signature motif containing protein [Rhodococcus sp. IEGM 1408]|uniref:HNH endonuclease signature motif containing protein n=1 Tax=Rhodococcus sp. IEGM 1408 TaxID=3082220 RepID=UPI002953A40F|nr:DUF222 domain-containing protein [Rhodococcus sp. IEGM 1408]MDV8001800.1 DUF222 domain-containing protein [Rhodococcus sp. IEGM 1408]